MFNQNNVTIDRLRYFARAAEFEHVGRAAKSLHVTPSVISSAIKTLEWEFGHDLFIREKQRIKLTEKGQRLFELASDILRSTASLKSELDSGQARLSGHIRIGASHFLMGKYLTEALSCLADEHPDLTFELSSLDSGTAISKIQTGLLDFALVFRSSYREKLAEDILWNGDFKVALKKDHALLKNKLTRRYEMLNQYPAISFRTPTGGNFWELHPALTGVGITPNGRFYYDDTEIAIRLLEKTSGWAFLPEIIINSDPRLRSFSIKKKLKAPVNVSLVRSEAEKTKGLSSILLGKLRSLF